MKWYILYFVVSYIFLCFKEGISFLFKSLPSYLQWIVAFLIPLSKHFEKLSLSKLVKRMSGRQDEASSVLLGLAVNVNYSSFVAVKLPGAEIMTVCFVIAVDFVIQLQLTYQIVKLQNKVTNEAFENGGIEKTTLVTKLVLAELTEGITPIVYAIGFATAHYGPNGSMLGYNKVDDVGHLFLMMLLLFGIDILCVILNSQILSTLTDVALYQEFCWTMKRYWKFMVVRLAWNSIGYFLTRDINMGVDLTGEFAWITQEGRVQLIRNSVDLLDDEKAMLLSQEF